MSADESDDLKDAQASRRQLGISVGGARVISHRASIEIDGRRFVRRDPINRRLEQLAAATKTVQPALFELRDHSRAVPERTAALSRSSAVHVAGGAGMVVRPIWSKSVSYETIDGLRCVRPIRPPEPPNRLMTSSRHSTQSCSPAACRPVSTQCSEANPPTAILRGQTRSKDGRETTDKIALNPSHFHERSTEQSLSTLVHEMTHLEQHHFGKPSRSGHHNKEWAELMRAVGRIPPDTQEPGGKQDGQRVSRCIERGGRLARLRRDGQYLRHDFLPSC
jgi:hypothetical protein